MNELNQDNPCRNSETDNFLYHEAQAASANETTGSSAVADSLGEVVSLLNADFPELLAGESFLAAAREHFEQWPRFGALYLTIDGIGAEQDPTEEQRNIHVSLMKTTATAVHAVCRDHSGLWGLMDRGAFVCFFPDVDDHQALERARLVQSRQAGAGSQTVTIGVAAYPQAYYDKAQILGNALKARDHAVFFGPGSAVCFDAVSLNISGDKYYQAHNIPGAVAEFEQALVLDPHDVNVLNSLGVCYGVLKQYDKAEKVFATAIDLDATDPMAFFNKGMLKAQQNDLEGALQDLLQADRIDTERFEIPFQIGKLYLALQEPQKGLAFLLRARRNRPEAAGAHACLGCCYEALDRVSEAITAYERAIKQNPNDAASLSALGALYLSRNENIEIAEVFSRQSISLEPKNGLLRFRLGKLLEHRQAYREALDAFRQADELGHGAGPEINAMYDNLKASEDRG